MTNPILFLVGVGALASLMAFSSGGLGGSGGSFGGSSGGQRANTQGWPDRLH
jgi:hypothetical protein